MSDFKAKAPKSILVWGSAPDPAGGAYSAPPDRPPSWIWALLLREGGCRKGGEGEKEGKAGREIRGGRVRKGEEGTPCYL